MLPVIILLIIEFFTILVLKERFRRESVWIYRVSVFFHSLLSIWLWYLLVRILTYQGEFDTPGSIRLRTEMMGMIIAVLMPRVLLILVHFTGRLIMIRKKNYIRWLTDSVLWTSGILLIVIALSTFLGSYNFRIEKVDIAVKGLHPGLNGLTIAQISDLHLSSYHNKSHKLAKAIELTNSLKPDLIINTGDFVTYGSGEYGSLDSVLALQRSRYGNYAVFGNHDMGTYMPGSTPEWREMNVSRMTELIRKSGYLLLRDENDMIEINGAKLAIIGVSTAGRHPDMLHGNPVTAMAGTDSADFRLLLAHDPNQWEADIEGKLDIDLTLSGHTHGMQVGIITRKFRWSPSKYFYPHWNGLYAVNGQFHYVNRGLGLLAIPFRIWMPAEITIIKLLAE